MAGELMAVPLAQRVPPRTKLLFDLPSATNQIRLICERRPACGCAIGGVLQLMLRNKYHDYSSCIAICLRRSCMVLSALQAFRPNLDYRSSSATLNSRRRIILRQSLRTQESVTTGQADREYAVDPKNS